jgi:hypothetical protein
MLPIFAPPKHAPKFESHALDVDQPVDAAIGCAYARRRDIRAPASACLPVRWRGLPGVLWPCAAGALCEYACGDEQPKYRAKWLNGYLARHYEADDFYWQRYIMPSPPLIEVPGVQPMPWRAA